ncbi:MAG: response regulator transcription factor [Collinsella sp.]|nr:response regulator transcription factor [Collinsella sp.]
MRVLIVEDARRLAEAMAEILRVNGFASDVAHDAHEAIDALAVCTYDVVLLDIMLPGQDGLDLLASLRADGEETPVILITARGSVEDRIRGLNLGADDYLPKPFHTEELIARIRAVTRRPRSLDGPEGIRALGVVLDPATHELRLDSAAPSPVAVRLSARECQLMEDLLRAPSRIRPKDALIARIWGPSAGDASNRLEVLVRSVRAKLKTLTTAIEIVTVRGVEYGLREGEES